MQNSLPQYMNSKSFPPLAICATLCAKITFLRELWWLTELTQACTGGHTGPSDLSPPFPACATSVWWNEQTGAGTAWAPCVNTEQIHRGKVLLRISHSVLEKLCSFAMYHRIIFSVVYKL